MSEAAQQHLVPRGRGESRSRFAELLFAVVLAFGLEGIGTTAEWEQIVSSALLGMTLLLALRVADVKTWVLRLATAAAIVLVLVSVVEVATGHLGGAATRIANGLLVALAPPAVIVGVLRTLRARQAVTVEAVLGVLSVYILLGMFFAFVYGSIDHLGGAPFFAAGQPGNISNCLYFSFSTLTTVGFGDFTARTNLGHTLTVSEALVGQIYLVTIVSLIVANLGRGRPGASAQ